MKRAVIASMALAQLVGFAKAEATIRITLSGFFEDPYWLRFWIYAMGGVIGVVLGVVNVKLIRRLDNK